MRRVENTSHIGWQGAIPLGPGETLLSGMKRVLGSDGHLRLISSDGEAFVYERSDGVTTERAMLVPGSASGLLISHSYAAERLRNEVTVAASRTYEQHPSGLQRETTTVPITGDAGKLQSAGLLSGFFTAAGKVFGGS